MATHTICDKCKARVRSHFLVRASVTVGAETFAADLCQSCVADFAALLPTTKGATSFNPPGKLEGALRQAFEGAGKLGEDE